MCIDWFYWWYNYAADIVPYSTGFAFVTKMCEKCKSTLSHAIQANICERPLVVNRN